MDASGQAQEALAVVDAQLEGLLSGCRRIANVLDRSRERTGILLNETARVNDNLAKVEERKKMLKTFLVDYQLTDEEIAALRTDDQITEIFSARSRGCRRSTATAGSSFARTTSARGWSSWT